MSENIDRSLQCPILALKVPTEEIYSDELAESLYSQFIKLADQAQARFVLLDMKKVKRLTSAGLRPFIFLNKHLVKERNGKLVVCHLKQAIRDVLEHTMLITTRDSMPSQFLVADTLSDAVNLIVELESSPS